MDLKLVMVMKMEMAGLRVVVWRSWLVHEILEREREAQV